MSAFDKRRPLNALMQEYGLSAAEVSEIIGRTQSYIRALRCGYYSTRPELIRLLKLELAARKRRPIAQPA